MARRNPQAKWVLPETVDPATRKCTTIQVPDDPQHIAAFRGALLALASAYNWQDDASHTAREVALVWRAIIDDMGIWGCSVLTDVRQKDGEPCVLEKEMSGEWQPFANLRYCPPNLRIAGGVLQYYDENTQEWVDYPSNTGGSAPGSQPGTQPGGDSGVPLNECKSIVLTVQGNGITIVPFRVLPGNTVLITEIRGAWTYNVNALNIGFWCCGEGTFFVAGQCGNPIGTMGDLVTDQPVTRLIAQYGQEYFDAQSTATIDASWDEDLLALRMNDSDTSYNAGSVTCLVTVCSGAWCHVWGAGFTAFMDVWTLMDDSTLVSGYIEGATTPGGNKTARVDYTFAVDTYISTIRVKADWQNANNGASIVGAILGGAVSLGGNGDGTIGTYTQDRTFEVNQIVSAGTLEVYVAGWGLGYARIIEIEIAGGPPGPFGEDNCA